MMIAMGQQGKGSLSVQRLAFVILLEFNGDALVMPC